MVKMVNFNVSQFKAKSAIESFTSLVTDRTLTKTSPNNRTKVSLGAKLPIFVHSFTGRFVRLHRVKLTVGRV